MKKIYSLVCLLGCIALTNAQTTVFEDDFETGWTDSQNASSNGYTVSGANLSITAKNSAGNGADSSDWYLVASNSVVGSTFTLKKILSLTAGNTYTFTIDFKRDNGADGTAKISIYDTDSNQQVISGAFKTNSWTEVSVEFDCTESKNYEFRIHRAWAQTTPDFHIDNILITSELSNDADSDGVADGVDNCPSTSNPGQEDIDGDGVGDVCDDDRVYNGDSDTSFSNTSNWTSGNLPALGFSTVINDTPTTTNVNADYSQKNIVTSTSRTSNFTFEDADDNNTLTIDIDNAASNIGSTISVLGILHQTTNATTLKIDADVVINNSSSFDGSEGQFDDWTIFKIEGNAGNIVEFGEDSTLSLNGDGGTGVLGNGEFKFNGTITGTETLGIGANTKATFGATSDNSGLTGSVTLYAGADVVVNTNTGNFFSSNKIQANGSGTITVNTENTIDAYFQLQADLALVLNADQNQLASIRFKNENVGQTFNITLGNGVSAKFESYTEKWTGNTVNINGFDVGTIRFGNNNTGLSAADLLRITIDGAAPSEPLGLDYDGKLIYASTLGARDKNESSDVVYSVYPNPTTGTLNVVAKETPIQKVQIVDAMGRTVQTIEVNALTKVLDISGLSNGVYILQTQFVGDDSVKIDRIIKQ